MVTAIMGVWLKMMELWAQLMPVLMRTHSAGLLRMYWLELSVQCQPGSRVEAYPQD